MTLWQSSLQAFALSLGGMTVLAFAMDRHYAQLTSLDEVPTAHRMALRVLGALLLLAVCLPAMRGWSASVGSVLVLGFWGLGALATVAGLSWSARYLAVAAAVTALLGGVSCLW
ncbi:DUF3325 domain-containing protein [Comamonas sp. E6]|uniref:DUF3325 domain-containing protein n=1 Tax=Comamonas sp. E6 TaxID=364029 RepID=UPI0006374B74|nr:DUF3325 domain-containing protein [Comamonas sp. E6]GAO73560.1 hypothetical protein CSE6_044_49970 [Comamonas sp. E6]